MASLMMATLMINQWVVGYHIFRQELPLKGSIEFYILRVQKKWSHLTARASCPGFQCLFGLLESTVPWYPAEKHWAHQISLNDFGVSIWRFPKSWGDSSKSSKLFDHDLVLKAMWVGAPRIPDWRPARRCGGCRWPWISCCCRDSLGTPSSSGGEWLWSCFHHVWSMWGFPKLGVPKNRWLIREYPIKMDDLGVSPF